MAHCTDIKNREILEAALAHRPGQVCIDLGSTAVTGIHISCVEKLRDYYGLEKKPVKVLDPYQMIGVVDEDLKVPLGVATAGVYPPNTMFGFPMNNWKEYRMPWGQEVLVPGDFNTSTDTNGDLLIHPAGDTAAKPSGRMPKGGYFFDTIIRQEKINENNLNPEDNLEEFGPIGDEDLAYFGDEVRKAAATGRGVVATFGGTAFGDIALVPAPFLKAPKGIRDITEWYISTVSRQDYLHAIFEKQCQYALGNLERIFAAVGNAVSAVFICGTDFGTQHSQFCGTSTFESLYAPYYRRVNDWIHANTEWKTFKHSCGAIAPFIKNFIDCGFDIINPVQYTASGMDSRKLKELYGRQIVFWGGGIDTQKVLPFGTPDEVRRETERQCRILGQDGGFVFNTVHNIQAGTPVENIAAIFETVKNLKL